MTRLRTQLAEHGASTRTRPTPPHAKNFWMFWPMTQTAGIGYTPLKACCCARGRTPATRRFSRRSRVRRRRADAARQALLYLRCRADLNSVLAELPTLDAKALAERLDDFGQASLMYEYDSQTDRPAESEAGPPALHARIAAAALVDAKRESVGRSQARAGLSREPEVVTRLLQLRGGPLDQAAAQVPARRATRARHFERYRFFDYLRLPERAPKRRGAPAHWRCRPPAARCTLSSPMPNARRQRALGTTQWIARNTRSTVLTTIAKCTNRPVRLEF